LRPDPAPATVEARVHVRAPAGTRFATGLERRGDAFVLGAHEIAASTYSVFGAFDSETLRPDAARGQRAEVEVGWLDGAVKASRADRVAWASAAVGAVADFYSGFPVLHALVAFVPIPDRAAVLNGKLLPAG